MSIVLKNQIEASEKSAEQLEAELRQSHLRAMFCHDIQDLMKSLVGQFDNLNQDVERWQQDMKTRSPDSLGELDCLGEGWDSFYRRLALIFEKVAASLQKLEKLEFKVDGKREFLLAWRELRGIVCFPRDRVIAAAEQVQRGDVRPLGEVSRELWDRSVG
ncbi:MAG TPA: hypothetical protein VFC46_05870 [Humisphaera sp.]|nr:hypothetical protein [Humisphaera sp.]